MDGNLGDGVVVERVWVLRLGCVLLTCVAALFLFELARRWTRAPLLATLIALLTPAQWLTSYSLLIDSTLMFWFLGGVFLFVRATETGRWRDIALSGVFMGMSLLTKYPAVLIFPLTAVWLFLERKKVDRPWRFSLAWMVGALFLIAYSGATAALYGAPHILAASQRMVHSAGWAKILVFFVFFSGALLAPVAAWRVVPLRWRLVALLAALVGVVVFTDPTVGGFSPVQGAMLAFWLVSSGLFFAALVRQRAHWVSSGDRFLIAWLVIYVALMLVVMDWVAARYFCLVGPAVAFLVVRLIDVSFPTELRWRLVRVAVAVGLMSAFLAHADAKQAEPGRKIGDMLDKDGFRGGPRHFYLGDSFTMSYLSDHGWTPCFPQTELRPGDWVLSKDVTMPLAWFWQRPIQVRTLTEYTFPAWLPLKVMDYKGSAGFYASVWGALPFTLSRGPWERFRLLEVVSVGETRESR